MASTPRGLSGDFDDQILYLYAKGLTTRQIADTCRATR